MSTEYILCCLHIKTCKREEEEKGASHVASRTPRSAASPAQQPRRKASAWESSGADKMAAMLTCRSLSRQMQPLAVKPPLTGRAHRTHAGKNHGADAEIYAEEGRDGRAEKGSNCSNAQ
ncbi:Hypothetical predicted protein [Pelobates cultripes]|uniref:Uncharacterized protein n=1 Tax=Pelobates cultripes TaxID=61616 RepID=A0AAD1RKE3_PELCU|nr:Hypothetical predicted protein [Pelobates cultripes]